MKPVEIEFLMKGNLGRGLDDARRKAESLDGILKKVGATVGIAFGTSQAIEFARKVMEVRGEVEALQVSFETLAGKTKGDKLFGDIREFAAGTPMMMQDLAKGAQTLLGFNIEAEKVMPILRQIGDISMGDSQKFNSLTLAFAQMSSTGRLMGQDLLQMVNAGFNPLVVISEKTGKSMASLKKEMGDGKISVRMVEEAFASATAEGGKFHGMLEKQSKGIKGAMSNLEGAVGDMLNEIGEKSQGTIVNAINNAQELVKNYDQVLDVLAQIVVAYGSYRAALMLVVAAQKAMAIAENIRLIMMFRKELGLLTATQQAFNRAALVNPYVMIGLAAAGAAVAVYNLAQADNAAESAQKRLNRTVEEANQKAKDHQRELEELTRTANDEAASTDDRRTAMGKLVDKYPAIIKKYIDEKGHLTDIINLKREIARMDGLEKQQQLEGDYQKAQRYLELYNKSRRGVNNLSRSEVEEFRKMTDEVWNKQSWWTQTKSGSRGHFVADYYRNQLPGLKREAGRSKTENTLREFNNELEKKTDEELAEISRDAQALLKRIGDRRSAIIDKYTNDFLTKGDLGERLGVISSILEQRHPQKKDDDVTDPKKLARMQKEQREQAAAAIEEEQRWQEEIDRIKRDARDARRDAEIAAIEDDGERERAAQDEQHQRNLRQIKDQADEIRKAVYEHNKKEWENAHKDSPYELTEAGQAGWQAIALSPEQQEMVSARTEKENTEYLRLVRDRYSQEVQAMLDFLKQYGTYEQRKLAITEEYERKIAAAERKGDTAGAMRLRKESQAELGTARAQELAKGIDFSQVVKGLSTVIDEIAERTYREIGQYKQTDEYKTSSAENKQAIAELEKKLVDAGYSGSVSPFNTKAWKDINKHVADYDAAVKKLTDVTDKHKQDVEALRRAQANLKTVISSNGSTVDIAVAMAGVKNAESQANQSAQEKQQAQGNVDATGDTVRNDLVKVDKGLKDFSTILGQVTSGSLTGFTLTVGNIIRQLSGDGDVAESVGELFGDAGKEIGGLISAILSIMDALGDDPSAFIDQILGRVADVLRAVIEQLPEIIMSILKGVGNIVTGFFSGIGGMLGFGNDNHQEMLKRLEKYNSMLETSSMALSRFTEELQKSYGAVAIQNSKEADEVVKSSMKTIMNGIDSVMWDNYGGGHSDYWHANNALNYVGGDLQNAGVVSFFKRYGLNMQEGDRYTWNELFNNNDPMKLAEAFKEMRDSGNDLWRIITTEMGANEGALKEWIEKLIEAYDQIGENEKSLMERLSTTTEENVFDDFLNQLYDLADGSADVMSNIGDNWQNMVNRMTINNLVSENFKERVKEWYNALVEVNRKRLDNNDDEWYRTELARLRDQYNDIFNDAKGQVDQFRDMGIIGSTGAAQSGQTAKTGGFTVMSQEQGTKLDGMFTAGLQHWSSMDKELDGVNDNLGKALDRLKKIEENTEHCKKLDDIAEDIRRIKTDGIKIK